MTKTKGTKEWAVKNINFSLGCSNACLYCYARRMANRFGRKKWADWSNMKNREDVALKKFQKANGIIMIPSSHDITPKNVDLAKKVIKNLLVAKNTVLIVSKPNPSVIRELSEHISKFRDQILWRFTIGTLNDDTRQFWESGAPSISDRINILEELFDNGWSTSVSIEPFLDKTVIELIKKVNPFITEKIWVGPMNKTHVPKKLWTEEMEKLYNPENLQRIKSTLDTLNNPKIKYKDHFLSKLCKFNSKISI